MEAHQVRAPPQARARHTQPEQSLAQNGSHQTPPNKGEPSNVPRHVHASLSAPADNNHANAFPIPFTGAQLSQAAIYDSAQIPHDQSHFSSRRIPHVHTHTEDVLRLQHASSSEAHAGSSIVGPRGHRPRNVLDRGHQPHASGMMPGQLAETGPEHASLHDRAECRAQRELPSSALNHAPSTISGCAQDVENDARRANAVCSNTTVLEGSDSEDKDPGTVFPCVL